MFRFRHAELIDRDPEEVARLRAFFTLGIALGNGVMLHSEVYHVPGGACCRREPWARTVEILQRELFGKERVDHVDYTGSYDPFDPPAGS